MGSNALLLHFLIYKCIVIHVCFINVRNSVKFHCFPCKYGCLVLFFFQNTWIWLLWFSFGRNHGILCMGGFIYKALIRNLPCIPTFPYQKCSNLCILLAFKWMFGKFHCFPCKNLPFVTLQRAFSENLVISQQKSTYFLSNVFLLCIIFVFYQITA